MRSDPNISQYSLLRLTAAQKLARYVYAKTPSVEGIPYADSVSPEFLSVAGTCPLITPAQFSMALAQSKPEEVFPILRGTSIAIWAVLLVYDNSELPEVTQLATETVQFYRDYCAKHMEVDRPAALANIKRRQDIFPCITVMANNDEWRENLVIAEAMSFISYPLLLTLDAGIPTRQHVGEIDIKSMREFLERVPSSVTVAA